MSAPRIRGLFRHVVRHPLDAVTLGRSAWLLRRRGWWKTPPFLPIPSSRYWAFRLTTAYGNPDAVLDVRDAVDAARWSLRQRSGR